MYYPGKSTSDFNPNHVIAMLPYLRNLLENTIPFLAKSVCDIHLFFPLSGKFSIASSSHV